jgi:hypothetical protein
MRELVLAELETAIQEGPLMLDMDGEETVDTVDELRALSDQELLTVLITMLSDA